MDLASAAMGSLALKLLQGQQLIRYSRHEALTRRLAKKLESMQDALCKVTQVPHDQIDPQVMLWAREVREASYDMEHLLDNLVHIDRNNTLVNRLSIRVAGEIARIGKAGRIIFYIKKQIHEMHQLVEKIVQQAHPRTHHERETTNGMDEAMGNLPDKVLQLLQDQYKLQKSIKMQVESLSKQLEGMQVTLCMVAKLPYDQLDSQVKLWASQTWEASYQVDKVLDTLLKRINGGNDTVHVDKGIVHGLLEKLGKMFCLSRVMARHKIARAIKDIKKQMGEIPKRADQIVVNSSTTIVRTELVGIDEPCKDLIMMLTLGDDDSSNKEMKIVSIVGSAGMGKTTLAKVVYEKLTSDKNAYCKAFVSVGRNPDMKKVFRDILLCLDKTWCMSKANFMILEERQLKEEIQALLIEKRYFIVIDDLWEVQSWETLIKALEDNNLASKIIITSRHNDIVHPIHGTYTIRPLHHESSKLLFYGRIFGSQKRCPTVFSELSDKILRKCDGVPLAIITIASLLANTEFDIRKWQEVYNSMDLRLSDGDTYNGMTKIFSLSYHDLPPHMKTCFLYLSMYPEDYEMSRDGLIWRWICEGFIQPREKGDDLYEIGKRYFNDLINRSLLQPVIIIDDEVYACRMHDIILDLICSLSREEGFVTTSSDIEQVMSSGSIMLHRLSLKNTNLSPKEGIERVKSIALFGLSIDSMPFFSNLRLLCILDLEGCSLKNYGGSKLHVGNLIHLRYLGLRGTDLNVLPSGVEKLRFLMVLRLDNFIELPDSIFGLRQLMCLEGVRCCPRLRLRNLASLQVLDTLYLDNDLGAVDALGCLTRLTVLEIFIKMEMVDQSFCDSLMNSLGNLTRLKFLRIWCNGWERCANPPHLGVNATSFPCLTYLDMMIHTVRPEDIQIIGTLPKLVAFQLEADYQNYLQQPLQKLVVSADGFPRLRRCFFRYVATVPSMFTQGAMSRVEYIRFCLRAKDFFSKSGKLDFKDLAMDHLPSLRDVTCFIHTETDVITGEEEVAKLRDELQRKANGHPNHPKLSVY